MTKRAYPIDTNVQIVLKDLGMEPQDVLNALRVSAEQD